MYDHVRECVWSRAGTCMVTCRNVYGHVAERVLSRDGTGMVTCPNCDETIAMRGTPLRV